MDLGRKRALLVYCLVLIATIACQKPGDISEDEKRIHSAIGFDASITAASTCEQKAGDKRFRQLIDPIYYLDHGQGRRAACLRWPGRTDSDCAALDFLCDGQFLGLKPNFMFDEESYRATNLDVDRAVKAGTFRSGFEHFALYGQFEFDRLARSKFMKDVPLWNSLPGVPPVLALQDFVQVFDSYYYQQRYAQDIRATGAVSPIAHYIGFIGYGRRSIDGGISTYWNDIYYGGAISNEGDPIFLHSPLEHYITWGMYEPGRRVKGGIADPGLAPKLVAIPDGRIARILRSRTASGFVEVELGAQDTTKKRFIVSRKYITGISPAQAADMEFMHKPGTAADLVVLAYGSRAEDPIRLTTLLESSSYLLASEDYLTGFSSWEKGGMFFALANNGDLFGVKYRNTGTNTVEIHVLSRASNYRIFTWQTGSAVPESEIKWSGIARFALVDRDVVILNTNPSLDLELSTLKASDNYTRRSKVDIFQGAAKSRAVYLNKAEMVVHSAPENPQLLNIRLTHYRGNHWTSISSPRRNGVYQLQ